MLAPADKAPTPRPRLLTFRSGGWILVLAVIFSFAALLWWLYLPSTLTPRPGLGDGRHVKSYGFDLSDYSLSKKTLVASGAAKDGIRSLQNPETLPADKAKFLRGSDRVIGVSLHGEARAYPLSILNWHEVVNDVVGGTPVAITYSPLCDSAVVFARTRPDGETWDFGVSGLLANSNLLIYDRRPEGAGESLWSQLLARAVAGPAARKGQALRLIPSELLRWADWRARHPKTRVLKGLPSMHEAYRRSPFSSYYGSDILRFPVYPLPPKESKSPYKMRTVIVHLGDAPQVFSFPFLAKKVNAAGRWSTQIEGQTIRFVYRGGLPAPTVGVYYDDGSSVQAVYAFWFAWYAAHPDAKLFKDMEIVPRAS